MAVDDTQCRALRFRRLGGSIAAMHLKRHFAWLAAALAFAAGLLPLLVYHTGLRTLGPYAGGGTGQFFADFYADLAGLRPGAWLLLLGPAAMVLVWRVLVAYAWPRSGS
jgi:hypothetical protein